MKYAVPCESPRERIVTINRMNYEQARLVSAYGGSPAATHFSCFAKKSKQKKATQKPLPATRVPKSNDHQSGAQTNSPLAQTGLRSLSA